jgi:two-component system, chemotaxis family, CheB/CheR fusion protein
VTAEPTAEPSAEPYLVVIGSSAGGIEALTAVLSSLPKDFGAPIVVAQHLDPARPSNLAAVLERRSTLPVEQVDSQCKMENGHVYVVASNRHITIHDGHVRAEGDHVSRPRPSIDLLLTTAAEQYREHLVAVVLTGAGSDGASGALEVKRHGGTVVIQNPATARFPSMPLALPPTAVDHIVDIEQLGGLLSALVDGVDLPDDVAAADGLRDILDLVSAQAGVDFSAYKQTTILRRIARRMAFSKITTLDDYRAYLADHREEVSKLSMAFLIKVTEFFRDEDAFDLLRERVLPVLIDRARTRGRTLRLWSAGCATGEEPYSLAMILADMLGPEIAEWNIKIFATDLDDHSINFARRGLYPEKSLAKMPDAYRARFFEETDSGFQMSKTLRQLVIFGQQDLTKGVPFPRIDLVVCRNLLIYFKSDLQQHVLDLFCYSLSHTGGYLFLGKAETARPSSNVFEMIDKRWKVYRCTKPPVVLTGRRLHTGQITPAFTNDGRLRRQPHERAASGGNEPVSDPEVVQLRKFHDVLLRVLPIGVVVVDRNYRMVNINPTARRLLGVRDIGQDQDFLHAVRGLPYAQVRDAIDTAFRDRTTVALSEMDIERVGNAPGRFLTLAIAYGHQESSGQEVCIVSVLDATETVQARRSLESIQAEQTRLVGELTSANRRFSEMNKDLQDANEELQATNEEMTVAQEELQASNEELEATNEELQATNEELETNNEELHATNEELEATNEELGARTQELADVARTLGIERGRLAEILEAAPIHLLVLRGPTLLVDIANGPFASLFSERAWSGRPIEEVLSGDALAPLINLIRDAYWKNIPGEEKNINLAGKRFDVRVVPVHDDDRVDSVVVFGRELP